jgi:hypothetical protein
VRARSLAISSAWLSIAASGGIPLSWDIGVSSLLGGV